MISKTLNNNYIICLLALFILLLLPVDCTRHNIIDPFWNINLKWDKKILTEKLNEYSHKGQIENCVFSFEKTTYIKNNDFDARIWSSLNYPVFHNNELESLNYSLVVEFYHEEIQKFNTDFYRFFKLKMTKIYGNDFTENTKNDRIYLTWKIENNITVHATILKDINYYIIKIDTVK